MLKKIAVFCLVFCFLFVTHSAYAIENPLLRPNNKMGIHILFTTEIPQAAKLINSSGGDWGYVTIPIQTNDKNRAKWQQFMTACKKYHVIPIVRLATESDFVDPTVWRKPHLTDIVEFANFLDTLPWPTKNRYVVVFNEVNRANEWGGAVNPGEYANILSFAVTVFKSKSSDFFLISAGLDNAAPNKGTNFMNQYDFMRGMNNTVPAIFNQVDGMASHPYPNPGFSQPPNIISTMGVASFKYERELAKTLTGKDLPVFITETGWSSESVTDEQKIAYYKETITSIWNDPGVVAVTPFLFEARGGDFQQFSFLTATGSATKQYHAVKEMSKTKGIPAFPTKVLAAATVKKRQPQSPQVVEANTGFSFPNMLQSIFTSFRGTK